MVTMVPRVAGEPEPGEPEPVTNPRLMVTIRVSGQPAILYLHSTPVGRVAVPGGEQVPVGTTPLATSELKTAVTTGCKESGEEGDAISLVGCAPATLTMSRASC